MASQPGTKSGASSAKSKIATMEDGAEIYRRIIESTSDYVSLLDFRGRYLYVSPSHSILGYTSKDLVGKSGISLVHPEDRPHLLILLAKYAAKISGAGMSKILKVKKEAHALRLNFRIPDKSGKWHYLESSPTIVRDPDGPGHLILLISRDVTERKKSEDELRAAMGVAKEERAKAEAVITAIGDGISIQDTNFRVLYQNEIHKGFVGSHLGEYCYKAYEHRNHVCEGCPLAESLRDGKVHSAERSAVMGGKRRYFEITSSPLMDASGKIVSGIEAARDVTGRKEMEEKIRESEERYRLLAESANEMIFILGRDYRVQYANGFSARYIGKSAKEIIGMPLSAIFPKEVASRQKDGLKRVFETGKPFYRESQFVFRGKTMWLGTRIVPIRDARGKAASVLGISRDITEQKKEELLLRESEERYRDIVDCSNDAIWTLDTKGRFVFCNARAEEISGYTLGEGRGRVFSRLLEKRDLVMVWDVFRKAVGGQAVEYEATIIRKDGSRRILSVNTTPIYSGGKISGTVSFGEDITEARKTEESLLKFKLGLERTDDAVFITDAGGNITYVNDAFTEVYGYPKEEAIGKTPRIIRSGVVSKEQYGQFWNTLLAKKVVSGEIVNKAKDGRLINIWASNNPILDAKGDIMGFLAIHRDITGSKKAEEKLKKLNEELTSKVEELERFTHLSVNRELKMIQLKERLKELESSK